MITAVRIPTLWLKYFSNFTRASDTQSVQLWGLLFNILATLTIPSSIAPLLAFWVQTLTDTHTKTHTHTHMHSTTYLHGIRRFGMHFPEFVKHLWLLSKQVFKLKEWRCATNGMTTALLTLSLAHWMVCSIVAGNDFSVQYGTSRSGGSCYIYKDDILFILFIAHLTSIWFC